MMNKVPSQPRPMAALTIPWVILLTSCGLAGTGDTVAIRIDSVRPTVSDRANQLRVTFTIDNRTGQTVWLPSCGELAGIRLETRTGGRWELIQDFGTCLTNRPQVLGPVPPDSVITQSVSVQAARTYRARIRWNTGSGTVDNESISEPSGGN